MKVEYVFSLDQLYIFEIKYLNELQPHECNFTSKYLIEQYINFVIIVYFARCIV